MFRSYPGRLAGLHRPVPLALAPQAVHHAAVAGGLTGWQIALIGVGFPLALIGAGVVVRRARATRRAVPPSAA